MLFTVNNLNKKQTIKRINYKLNSNFFSIDEILKSKRRVAIKIIRLIAKTEGIKLKKKEAVEIISYFENDLKVTKATESVNKIFKFIKIFKKTFSNLVSFNIFDFLNIFYFSNYRYGKYELMRN